MEEVLLAALALALGKNNDEVAELAKSDDKKLLTTAVKDKFKTVKTEAFDNGAKDREEKVRKEYETLLKTKSGITSSKKGEELVDEIFAEVVKPEKLSDEAIKSSKLFIDLEKKVETAKKEAEKEFEGKLETLKQEQAREAVLSKAQTAALKAFDDLKPVLSKDKDRQANQREVFIKELQNFDYEELDGGDFVIKGKDGKRLEDGAMNRVKFLDHVRNLTTKHFDLAEAQERSSTGNEPGGNGSNGTGGKTYSGGVPKTFAEFKAIQENKDIPAKERLEIAKAYNESEAQSATS